MVILVAISAVAGIVGTGIGGVLGVFFGAKTKKTLGGVLGFASGVMLSIVCFDLLPHAIFIAKNFFFVIATVLSGVLMVMLMRYFVDKYSSANKNSIAPILAAQSNVSSATLSHSSLYRAGIVMFLAISLHNFPEGMAITSSGYNNQTSGILLGALIAIHDIPEGMSIASPLVAGGMDKTKTVFLTALSGAFTLLGGIVGYLISSISPIFTALSIAFAAGAMLDVTFGELLPEALNANKGYLTSVFVIVGIIVGLILSTLLS